MHSQLELWDLFLQADWVVKSVMISLVLASIWSWTVIAEKLMLYRRLDRGVDNFEDAFWSGKALDHLYDEVADAPSSPIERVFASGMREWMRSVETGSGLFMGLRDRLDRAMSVAVARETELVGVRLGHLATIGAIAPFVGLFGTVWGIMNSFSAIAGSGDATLAVVAPGIAEALFATALGLLAAIPAVIAYNQLLAAANRINGKLENFADEFATILSRQLDKRGA